MAPGNPIDRGTRSDAASTTTHSLPSSIVAIASVCRCAASSVLAASAALHAPFMRVTSGGATIDRRRRWIDLHRLALTH
jgi:hypothetical protein